MGVAIQRPYCNSFPSIWQYRDAVLSGGIDFLRVIGPACPLCGEHGCWREIEGYFRGVIELFPKYREGEVLVARFQCRRTRKTFSLLPIQLIPYHRYTAASVVMALALALAHGLSLFGVAEKLLAGDSRANGYLLAAWLLVLVHGLRRAHPWLAERYPLSVVRSARRRLPADWLAELGAYLAALAPRASPAGGAGFLAVISSYAHATSRFLFGVPSQERRPRSVR
jgi:hypothetical protein